MVSTLKSTAEPNVAGPVEQSLSFVSSQINSTPFSLTMELDDSVILPLELEMLIRASR